MDGFEAALQTFQTVSLDTSNMDQSGKNATKKVRPMAK